LVSSAGTPCSARQFPKGSNPDEYRPHAHGASKLGNWLTAPAEWHKYDHIGKAAP